MDLEKIIEVCKDFDISEKRYSSEEYYEVVFFAKDVNEWIDALSSQLGTPEKPAGTAPSKDHFEITEPYGGIRREQTLFCKGIDEGQIVAMFWPWTDDVHITLRMVRAEK